MQSEETALSAVALCAAGGESGDAVVVGRASLCLRPDAERVAENEDVRILAATGRKVLWAVGRMQVMAPHCSSSCNPRCLKEAVHLAPFVLTARSAGSTPLS